MGGACDRAALVKLRGRREVNAAIENGTLIRTARGRYALGQPGRSETGECSGRGAVSPKRRAALGLGSEDRAGQTDVTVPRTRRITVAARELVVPHWADLGPDDVAGMVTSPRRTLVDCMRNLPLDEAVPIVDSAIRAGDFTKRELIAIAATREAEAEHGSWAVADEATSKAANAFESVARAEADLVPGLEVEAQFPVAGPTTIVPLHPDLADPALGIIIEAESFDWHGESAALTRDCRRYNSFTRRDGS